MIYIAFEVISSIQVSLSKGTDFLEKGPKRTKYLQINQYKDQETQNHLNQMALSEMYMCITFFKIM